MVHGFDVADELHTVSDYLRWSATQFEAANLHYAHGVGSAWDEAVVLVCSALQLPDDKLHHLLDARLTAKERARLADMVRRRVIERVPVPYLTGVTWYAGLKFRIDSRGLIPRSPIAELLGHGLRPWLSHQPLRVLDLCCGSGCIGIVAAYAFPAARIDLVDCCEDALALARENVALHGMQDRAECVRSDLFTALSDRYYDVILANPPYVPAAAQGMLPQEYSHEPVGALYADGDGLALAHAILDQAPRYLAPAGVLVLEVGEGWPTLAAARRSLPLIWPEFEGGGEGVCVVKGAMLARARSAAVAEEAPIT